METEAQRPTEAVQTHKQVTGARLGQGGSFENRIANALAPQFPPVVGMGATECRYTDRAAFTIIEVSANGKRLVVQEDKATRTDSNGMSECQGYAFEANPNGARHAYTLRKDGRWVREGESLRGGQVLNIGRRQKYHDYSF